MPSRLNYDYDEEPDVKIKPVGDHSMPQYTVDVADMSYPEPRAFELLCAAQVKLAVAPNHLENNDLDKRISDVVDEIGDILWHLAEVRELDEKDAQDVVMGNLDALPEVEKVNE